MGARNCIIPLIVRLQGLPDDERLVAATEAIAGAVADRLSQADRIIAAREGWNSWRHHHATPEIRVTGTGLDEDLRRRITAAIQAGIARALAGVPHARHPARAPNPFILADLPTSAGADPDSSNNDGINIAPGQDDAFWRNFRSQLLERADNNANLENREELIQRLLQGIRRRRARALIEEALGGHDAILRFALIDALLKISHDRPLAWKLMLNGLERPGDLLGYEPFDARLAQDPEPLITFLESVLRSRDEPDHSSAVRAIRHYFQSHPQPPGDVNQRRTYERLKALASRHDIDIAAPTAGPSNRVANYIRLVIDSIPAIIGPLTPAAPRETAATNDEHTLDALGPLLTRLRPDEFPGLEARILAALRMTVVLPDRISTIQNLIRTFATGLKDEVPSDEIVALQRLRRKYLKALAQAPNSDRALEDFHEAESDFADLRNPIIDVKFDRLSHEFDEASKAVFKGVSLHESDGVDDPAFAGMYEILVGYQRSFTKTFSPANLGRTPIPVIVTRQATSFEAVIQLEADLQLFSLLGALFLLFNIALRYEHDIFARNSGNDSWRRRISRRLREFRLKLVTKYWNLEDYSKFINDHKGLSEEIKGFRIEIEAEEHLDEEIRTVILLEATLVAGVVGVIARAALIGRLIAVTSGAARLAVAVTEAVAFTGSQVLLDHLAFGTPISITGIAKDVLTNAVQFEVLGAISQSFRLLQSPAGNWANFLARHALGLTLQADISALSLAIQARQFPPNITRFLVETLGGYVIGAAVGHIGGQRLAEFKRLRESALLRAVEAAIRDSQLGEISFKQIETELLQNWERVKSANNSLRDEGILSPPLHTEAQNFIFERELRISTLEAQGGRAAFTGPLLLNADHVPGLVKVGPGNVYQYDPQHPPARLPELAHSFGLISGLEVSFEDGTLAIRESGSSKFVLLIEPRIGPTQLLLPAPAPDAPASLPRTFLESAAGGPLTAANLELLTGAIKRINELAIRELESRGDAGLAALSLLVKYRASLTSWPIEAVQGLAKALELPRGITRASLERFFSRSSDQIATLFANFNDVANRPGANLTFRHPGTQRTILLMEIYKKLGAKIPPGMTEAAQRGLLQMTAQLGREAAIEKILDIKGRRAPERRLAELIRNDQLTPVQPTTPAAQQILDRHAGDVAPGINLSDPALSPAQVRAQIEEYAKQHGGKLNPGVFAQVEASIKEFRNALQRVQSGDETDSRNLDGTRAEFKALFRALDRGAEILSFFRRVSGDKLVAVFIVSWESLRGRITVKNAPKEVKLQFDLLAKIDNQLHLEEVTTAKLDLPKALQELATNPGRVSVDWSVLNDSTLHRKWRQILKNIAVIELGQTVAGAFGSGKPQARFVVRAEAFSKNALTALKNLGVEFEFVPPCPPPRTKTP